MCVCVCVYAGVCVRRVSDQEGAVACIINELILLLLLSKKQKAWTEKTGLASEVDNLNENNSRANSKGFERG